MVNQLQFEYVFQLPELFPLGDAYETRFDYVGVHQLLETFSPMLLIPRRTRRAQVVPSQVPSTSAMADQMDQVRRRQRNRNRTDPRIDYEIVEDVIKEEVEIDESTSLVVDLAKLQDFIESSCCGAQHCNHYAYARPNSYSYVAFVDNFLNGSSPSLFCKLQSLYKEMHNYIKCQPLEGGTIRAVVGCYGRTIRLMGLRLLKCISCIIDLIYQLIDIHNSFLDEFEERLLFDYELDDLFFDMDSAILQLVVAGDYLSDIDETVNPIENFVYQSLNSCLVTYLRGVYNNITLMTGSTLRDDIHEEVVLGYGVQGMRDRVLHLGFLAGAIRDNREGIFMQLNEETSHRKYFYDGGFAACPEAWKEFLEVYLSGSFTLHYSTKKWDELKTSLAQSQMRAV